VVVAVEEPPKLGFRQETEPRRRESGDRGGKPDVKRPRSSGQGDHRIAGLGGLRRAKVAALDVGDFDPAFGLRRVRGKGVHEEAVARPDRA